MQQMNMFTLEQENAYLRDCINADYSIYDYDIFVGYLTQFVAYVNMTEEQYFHAFLGE